MKLLEAGDRSSQVGRDHLQLLAWILQRAFSKSGDAEKNALLSLLKASNAQKKGRTQGQIVRGILVHLFVLKLEGEPRKTCLPVGLDEEMPEYQRRDAGGDGGVR